MSIFTENGIRRQQSAVTREEATADFNRSCSICASKGTRIDCDRCPIAAAHAQTLALLPPQPKPKPGKFISICTEHGVVYGGNLVSINGRQVSLNNAKEYRWRGSDKKRYARFVGDILVLNVTQIALSSKTTITLTGG